MAVIQQWKETNTRGWSTSVAVVTHGRGYSAAEIPAGTSAVAMEAVWQGLQADLATLTPTARQIIATESGHYVPLEQPEVMIEAVRAVVEDVRWGSATAAG